MLLAVSAVLFFGWRAARIPLTSVAPAIPLEGVKLKFVFHQFYDDQGGDNLGQE